MEALSAFNRMEQLSGLSAASPHPTCGRGCGLSATTCLPAGTSLSASAFD
ncbi:MAG: hypothetical protein ABIP30_04445 [Ferruginibacter sp.]